MAREEVVHAAAASPLHRKIGGGAARRLKPVRFGKSAFLQLNGANFDPKKVDFGYFAQRFQ